MTNHTHNIILGLSTEVAVNFDHEKADPDVGLGPELLINSIKIANDDWMDHLNQDCIDKIETICLEYMGEA